MSKYTANTTKAGQRRRVGRLSLLAMTVAGLAAAGCSVSDALSVEDPDIINPSDVQSAAGAEAVRLGALARLNAATSGAESLFLLGGLFADEWVNGDSFIARQEIDQRVITVQNNFLTDANRTLHRARLSAEQAIELLQRYNSTGPAWQVAEMYFVRAYVMNLIAEHYCDGIVFSGVVEGRENYGKPIATTEAFTQALALASDGLALITGATTHDVRVQNALRILRGRVLLNLGRPAEAATAVAAVPTAYQYTMQHSATTQSNVFWTFNNNARRYSVGNAEGVNGMNFATAADPRVPVCVGGDPACRGIGVPQTVRDDLTGPFHVQMLWPTREAAVGIIRGVEARLIEAEAQLRAGNAAGALTTLNGARATVQGLAPLADAGSETARVNQLFRERAFWLFGRGHRVGDLRRLIRQYGRAQDAVFPTGTWHKGGNYGTDVNMPVPLAEANNPNVSAAQTCLNRTP